LLSPLLLTLFNGPLQPDLAEFHSFFLGKALGKPVELNPAEPGVNEPCLPALLDEVEDRVRVWPLLVQLKPHVIALLQPWVVCRYDFPDCPVLCHSFTPSKCYINLELLEGLQGLTDFFEFLCKAHDELSPELLLIVLVPAQKHFYLCPAPEM